MINLLPFCNNEIVDSLISAEVYEYFDRNIFNDIDTSKITLDNLIEIFKNKDLIEKSKSDLSMSTNDFFTYIVFYLKDEIDLKQLTRSKKKIRELQLVINDIP